MGLRLAEGIELARLERIAGRPHARCCSTLAAIEAFTRDGWLNRAHGRLAATAAGRQRLDALLAALVADPGAPPAASTPRANRLLSPV